MTRRTTACAALGAVAVVDLSATLSAAPTADAEPRAR
jgi:hypothetical protein